MTGAMSPTGEKHPGVVVQEDRVTQRTENKQAKDLPQFIAWVEQPDGWKAVTRIEITGTPAQRCITKFGADGQMLETTMSAPPPRPQDSSEPQ